MGVEDRDWYREAQREREKQRQIEETRSKFAGFSRQHLGAKAVSPTKTGLIPMMIFLVCCHGVAVHGHDALPQAQASPGAANGDLVINRSHDGHFYTTGTINGRDAKFLVDTGASLVSVSEKFAQKAFIRGGVPTTFKTANGDRFGRVVDDVGVSIGPVSPPTSEWAWALAAVMKMTPCWASRSCRNSTSPSAKTRWC